MTTSPSPPPYLTYTTPTNKQGARAKKQARANAAKQQNTGRSKAGHLSRPTGPNRALAEDWAGPLGPARVRSIPAGLEPAWDYQSCRKANAPAPPGRVTPGRTRLLLGHSPGHYEKPSSIVHSTDKCTILRPATRSPPKGEGHPGTDPQPSPMPPLRPPRRGQCASTLARGSQAKGQRPPQRGGIP